MPMPDDQTSLQRRLLLRVLFERLFHRSDDPPAAVEPTVPLTEATAADLAGGAVCRICFEGGEGLCSPCRCAGTQRFIHVRCLRRWQRSSSRDPERAQVCTVCRSTFALPPLPPPEPPVKVGTLLVASPDLRGTFARAVVLLTHFESRTIKGFILNKPGPAVLVDASARDRRPAAAEPTPPGAADAPAPEALDGAEDGTGGAAGGDGASCSRFGALDVSWRRGGPVCGGRLGVVSFGALHDLGCSAGESIVTELGGTVVLPMQGALPASWSANEIRARLGVMSARREAACGGACGGDDEPPRGRALVFVGHAAWGRKQLAHEWAEGRWATCDATAADVFDAPPSEDAWEALRESGRLSYLPTAEDE